MHNVESIGSKSKVRGDQITYIIISFVFTTQTKRIRFIEPKIPIKTYVDRVSVIETMPNRIEQMIRSTKSDHTWQIWHTFLSLWRKKSQAAKTLHGILTINYWQWRQFNCDESCDRLRKFAKLKEGNFL